MKPPPFRWIAFAVAAAGLAGSSGAGQQVALRVAGAKYLKAAPDGALKAERSLPTADELFVLVPREGGGISLKAPNGRLLVFDPAKGPRLHALGPISQPGQRETFAVVPVEANRVAMKPHGSEEFVAWEGTRREGRGTSDEGRGTGKEMPVRPEETVEIFQAIEIPASIRSALTNVVQGRLSEELANKPYDKVRSRKNETFIDLPAPTLRDPGRTRSVRVFSTVEEYRIQARLDGKPELEITHMPYLKGYQDRGIGILLFAVRARLPVQGRVTYKLPSVVSASCGYRAVAAVTLVGEVCIGRSGSAFKLDSPELREIHVRLSRLELSNDLLHAAREPIEDLINHEIRKNEENIRQQANRSLAKAIQTRQFNLPLLQFLGLL
jgi:hypothetical protein